MTQGRKPPPSRGVPTRGGKGALAGKGKGAAGGKDKPKHPETQKHAQEVKAVMRGLDIVDKGLEQEHKPAAFQNSDMLVVRSWMNRRPLEPKRDAAAMVQFPRMWSTRRGRYCRFVAPGAGSYGILRARPSF